MGTVRFFSLTAGLFAACVLSAQGGQGGVAGGGGGFGGGGFQGGRADFTEDSEEFTKQLFLSPSDRTEWTFEAKENETILVKVTSAVFDPAVAIHDEKGAKLAENDDLEPGNQMAQLVYAVPKAGTYKAVVTNYKGTAGGSFNFYARRFLSQELRLGKSGPARIGDKKAWSRIALSAVGDYAVSSRGSTERSNFAIMRPNGEIVDDGRLLDFGDAYQRTRFRATEAGTYFVFVSGAGKPEVKVAPIETRDASIGTSNQTACESDQVYDWRVECKAGDLLEVALSGDPEGVHIFALTPERRAEGDLQYVELSSPGILSRYVVAAIHDGRITFCVRQVKGVSTSYELKVSRTGRQWANTGAVTSQLSWFRSEFWTFTARPGDVVKLRGASEVFETSLLVMTPRGNFEHASVVGKTPEVDITFPVREAGQHVIRVMGGGIGRYRLERETLEPRVLKEGGTDSAVGADKPDVWRFTARAGLDIVLRIASDTLQWRVEVIGPKGESVGTLSGSKGIGSDFLRLRLNEAGDYTIVVTPTEGTSGSYRLKWLDLDK